MSGKQHWEKEKTVSDFDDIYDNKGKLVRLANRFLRPSMKANLVTAYVC